MRVPRKRHWWRFIKFSYEDFDIEDKQKVQFLELVVVYVPVCFNFWENIFWEQQIIFKNFLRIDSSQQLMNFHKTDFLILKVPTCVSMINAWLLNAPFQLTEVTCRWRLSHWRKWHYTKRLALGPSFSCPPPYEMNEISELNDWISLKSRT